MKQAHDTCIKFARYARRTAPPLVAPRPFKGNVLPQQ